LLAALFPGNDIKNKGNGMQRKSYPGEFIIRAVHLMGRVLSRFGILERNSRGNGAKELWLNGWMIPLRKENRYDGMIITIRNMTRIHRLNESLLASLEFVGCPVAIALQEDEGGPVTSYHMNREGMELMGITQFAFEHNNIRKSMLASASLMKNGAEWVEFTKNNFTGREFAEIIIHMRDGRKYVWESKALRDQKRNYYGRIVHLREILKTSEKDDTSLSE
jgi:hypothetical protein